MDSRFSSNNRVTPSAINQSIIHKWRPIDGQMEDTSC